jgi:hypothetical protein
LHLRRKITLDYKAIKISWEKKVGEFQNLRIIVLKRTLKIKKVLFYTLLYIVNSHYVRNVWIQLFYLLSITPEYCSLYCYKYVMSIPIKCYLDISNLKKVFSTVINTISCLIWTLYYKTVGTVYILNVSAILNALPHITVYWKFRWKNGKEGFQKCNFSCNKKIMYTYCKTFLNLTNLLLEAWEK